MKKFLLYLGCPRAGSTWLWSQLSQHPSCNFGLIKEYHGLIDNYVLDQDMDLGRLRVMSYDVYHVSNFLTNSLRDDRSLYYNYFSTIAKNPYTTLTGDFSLSNIAISLETMHQVRKEFAIRDIEVLPVIILRDPLKILQSWARLRAILTQDVNSSEFEQILNHIELPYNMDTNKGPVIQTLIENATSAFGKVYIDFYEDLFNDRNLMQLTKYLGLTDCEFDTTKFEARFSDQGYTALDPLEIYEIYSRSTFYKLNYKFAVNYFGREKINKLWTNPLQ